MTAQSPTDYSTLPDTSLAALALALAGDPVALALIAESVAVHAMYCEQVVAAWEAERAREREAA